MKKQFQKPTATTTTTKLTTEQIYEKITDSFINAINNSNTMPWQKPWRRAEGGEKWVSRSRNLAGYTYNGINAMILDSKNLEVSVWGTFKQWKNLDFSVTKGEKGTITVLWLMFWVKTEPNGKLKYIYNISDLLALPKDEQEKYQKRFKLSYNTLFHIGQISAGSEQVEKQEKFKLFCEKWVEKFKGYDKPIEPKAPVFWHERAEQIVERWDVNFRNVPQDRAYYTPALDMITMPLKEQFPKMSEYYSVLFHEGCHASGHESRLKRDGIVNRTYFGSQDYSFEELVAEIGTAFVCSELNIEKDFDNSAAYVKNWVSKLKSNPEWIVKASKQAEKAANWVLGWLDGESVPTEIEETEAAEMEA